MSDGSDKRLELAYDAAQEHLAAQDTALSNVRTRANNLLATAALFASFSVSVGLINTDQKKGAVFPAWAGITLLLIVIALGGFVLVVLWTIPNWIYVPSATVILEKRAGNEDEQQIQEFITKAMIAGASQNAPNLAKKQKAFRTAAILLIVEVAVLIVVLVVQVGS